MRNAIEYLVKNLDQPFSMERLARHCNLSQSRLAHLFKTETQSSPQHFFEAQKIRHACRLLRITTRSIAEIAGDVGYTDSFYFTKRFRHQLGLSPSAFRKNPRSIYDAAGQLTRASARRLKD